MQSGYTEKVVLGGHQLIDTDGLENSGTSWATWCDQVNLKRVKLK